MMKQFVKKMTIIMVAVMAFTMFISSGAHAIPAFTRANNVECSTCHTIFPELNEYGDAFLKNSYVYFGKGKKKTAEKTKATHANIETKVSAGTVVDNTVKGEGNADLLSKLKAGMMVTADTPAVAAAPVQVADAEVNHAPVAAMETKLEGVALSGIPEQLPISFTANLHGTYDPKAINEFDFSVRSLKLNAGGNFKEKVGFFGSYILYTENVDKNANTSAIPTNMLGKSDIGELFLVWRHALDTPVNIKIGRFQPKLGLWKTNNKLAITNSYATYAYTVGSSLFKAEQPQDALEASVIVSNRAFLAGGVVNRKNQNTKEWYAHTSIKFGGADYLANEPEIDLNKDESIFDYLTMTVGGYGYVGTNGEPNTTVGKMPIQNNYYRAGMDIDLLYKLFRLKLSGVAGEDDNPALNYVKPPVRTYAAALEAQYTILLNLIAAHRFEYLDDGVSISRCYIPTLAYTPIENMKVVAEYKNRSGVLYGLTGNKEIAEQIGTLGITFSF